MATEAQIAANRLNSQNSTGPRTPAGKQASRMNALKSGLHAESLVIRSEDPAALAELTAEYHAEFHPVTPRQRELVDTLVHNTWLIRRLRRSEAELYAHYFQGRDDDFDPKWRFRVLGRQYPLCDSFGSLQQPLARIQSRTNSLERSSRAALNELRAARASVPGVPASDPSTESPVPNPEPRPPIGFVPSPEMAGVPPSAPSPECRIPDPRPRPPIGFVPPPALIPNPEPCPPRNFIG